MLVVKGGFSSFHEKKVREYIEAHLADKIFMTDVQNLTPFSRMHFGRCFKASFGECFELWLIHRRFEEAKKLMATTNESMVQIAFASGFPNQSHFSRKFRQHIGCAPQEWRKGHKEIAQPVKLPSRHYGGSSVKVGLHACPE